VATSPDIVKPFTQALLPPVVDRLGDNRQDVRQAACNLMLEVLQVQLRRGHWGCAVWWVRTSAGTHHAAPPTPCVPWRMHALSPCQQVLRPEVMMERLGRFWAHKSWKVRHGLLQFVAEAISISGEGALALPRDEANWVLHRVIALVGDAERCVGGGWCCRRQEAC
jgi:hypothetical protein